MPSRTPPPAPTDPLADLRPEDTPAGPPVEDQPTEPFPVLVLQDLDWHRESTAQVVAAWHADRATVGLIHGGGVCGCRHLAALALRAVHGPPADPAKAEEDGPDQ